MNTTASHQTQARHGSPGFGVPHAGRNALPSIEHRLSRALVDPPEVSFGSFANLPSNSEAVQAAERFAAGIHPFTVLVGPSGWGKSHLIASIASRMEGRGAQPKVLTATEWVLGMTPVEADTPLLLENAQDLLPKPRLRQALRAALETRVQDGAQTLLSFTTVKAGRSLRILLPNPRAWQWSGITSPNATERIVILHHMAEAEHLVLSESLVRLLAARLRGNGRTLSGALKRLKLYGADWHDPALTLKACGTLDMFFRDDSDWDLCEAIRTASRSVSTDPDLALYVMLREANLSESQVAHFFGVQPSLAYQLGSRMAGLVTQSPELREEVAAVAARTVKSLYFD